MKLKDWRKKRGVSQIEIAKAINIPQTSYSRYEQGNCDPNISTLIKLADFFNISIDELVERPTDMVNLNLLDDTRKNLIREIINASDVAVGRLDAFYQGIKLAEHEREEIVKKLKGNKNDD